MSKKAWKKAPGFQLAEKQLVDLVRKCANTLSLYLIAPQPEEKDGEVVFSGPLKGLDKAMAYKLQMQAAGLVTKYMSGPILNILKVKLSQPASGNTPIEAFVKALGEHGGKMAIEMGKPNVEKPDGEKAKELSPVATGLPKAKQ